MGENAKETPKESPQSKPETVSEADLQQAKKEYGDRWDLLKKFRDKDKNVQEERELDDASMAKLSLRAGMVIKEFQKKIEDDKKGEQVLVDPEKVFAPEVKDKERITGTLSVLDQIIEKFSDSSKNSPEWLRDALTKKPKEEFATLSNVAFDRLLRLRHPTIGAEDPSQKNPDTNDYIRDPGALGMLDHLMERIGLLNSEVQASKNPDFINAAKLELKGIDAEIRRVLAMDAGRGSAYYAVFDAFVGVPGGKSFKGLPRASQTDKVLLDRVQDRLKHAQGFDLSKVPQGTTWTFTQEGISVEITKGAGRECTARIVNVGIWVPEKYGASFVKYLTPEDRRMVKSVNESTGEVVVERRWPVAPDAVPAAVASQYAKLDPEFDKDPSPKRVTAGEDIYLVSRSIAGGKKTYTVEKVEPSKTA